MKRTLLVVVLSCGGLGGGATFITALEVEPKAAETAATGLEAAAWMVPIVTTALGPAGWIGGGVAAAALAGIATVIRRKAQGATT